MKRIAKTFALALILAAGFLGVSAQTDNVKTSSACGNGSSSTSKPSLPR